MSGVLAVVTLRWGAHVVASRTAREGSDVALADAGAASALATIPPGTPGDRSRVRIVGDSAVVTVPAGCDATRGDGVRRTVRGADDRLPLRPGESATVWLGEVGSPPAPLSLHIEVTEGDRARFRVATSLFACGRGHALVVGVLHAAFLLCSGRMVAVDMDAQASVDFAEMQWALERAERRAAEEGAPSERFYLPKGQILPLDAPRSSLLDVPWVRKPVASRPRDLALAPARDLDDRAAFVLPAAPDAVE